MTSSGGTPSAVLARGALLPVLVGASLGILSYFSDVLPESASRFLSPIVSSAFGWGIAALVAGFFACSLRSALLAAIGTLAVATAIYYCLILFVSLRWYHAAPEIGGEHSASFDGRISVVRAIGFWLAGSIFAGVLLGYLGYLIRCGSVRRGSFAAGIACGLLAGEGAYALFRAAFIWVGAIDSFVWAKIQLGLIQLLLTAGALALLLRFRSRPASWPVLAAAGTASLIASVGLWHLIEFVRQSL